MKGALVATETAPAGEATPKTPASSTSDPGAPEHVVEPTETTNPEERPTEPKTYDEAYVAKLREEAATHRVRAKRAEDAETRLRTLAVEQAARGVMADPADLTWDAETMTDEDGWPDVEKITAAATDLVERRPHLGRPAGEVGQGRHSDIEDLPSLSAMLRAGA